MYKPPRFMEFNGAPSRLNTSPASGAASRMAGTLDNQPSFDGVTVEQMKGNPLYAQHLDDIDKIGVAQKRVADAAKIVKSKEKMIRGLNDYAQKVRKPNAPQK